MREKAYIAVIIILGIIAVALVIWSLFVFSQPHKVDCDTVLQYQSGTNYKPIPKQCEKGE